MEDVGLEGLDGLVENFERVRIVTVAFYDGDFQVETAAVVFSEWCGIKKVDSLFSRIS